MRRIGSLLAVTCLTGCLALTQHDSPWPCTTDADCTGGDTCQYIAPGSSVCGGPGFCESSQDCAGDALVWQCLRNKCTPIPCLRDAECGPFACLGGACATSCTTKAQCGSGYVCEGATCSLPTCSTDADCGNYRCQNRQCVISCSTDMDCASGSLCHDGACAPRTCTTGTSGQCDGFLCVNGRCATTCTSNAECDPGLDCTSGTCACSSNPGACGGYVCVNDACLTSCTDDTQCASSHHCVGGRCVACGGTPVDCASQPGCSAAGCSVGQVCTGGAIACSMFDHAEDTCAGVLGCSYDVNTIQCVGTATCAGQPYYSCPTQFGCSQGTSCSGTPTACAQLTPEQCQNTAGCSLQ